MPKNQEGLLPGNAYMRQQKVHILVSVNLISIYVSHNLIRIFQFLYAALLLGLRLSDQLLYSVCVYIYNV